MMYYRRKILISILETFGGQLTRTQMQKLAFIFTRWQETPAYDFIPYHYGCYSFQANHDLHTLQKRGILLEGTNGNQKFWKKRDNNGYIKQLKKKEQQLLNHLFQQFGDKSQDEIIRYTYINYPYYAINSHIAKQYLDAAQLKRVASERVSHTGKKLFTIGYEGISLETYLNKLLQQGVKLLCDVRKNSFSMKFGFSKSQLQYGCKQLGIDFLHLPELGIESDKRRKLNSLQDYNALFVEYENTTLTKNREALLAISRMFNQYNRIAITCFEAHHCMCHRGRVAKALQALPDWDIPVVHL